MSGPRLHPGRLTLAAAFVLGALSLSSWFLGCTERTPNYCDNSRDLKCAPGQVCSSGHACVIADAAGDAAPTDGGDAPAGDAPVDRPGDDVMTGDGGDAGDAGDATGAHKGCVDRRDCTADSSKPVCEADAGVCVGCLQSTDCTDPQAPVCDTSVNRCVQCLTSKDCANPTPFCEARACRACKVDAECTGIGPEVCMAHLDGHCATDDETVYVASASGCAPSGQAGGSRARPFCGSQNGIDATTAPPPSSPDASAGSDANNDGAVDAGSGPDTAAPMKTLVVMRGPSLAPWSFNMTGKTITVVGQSGAALASGGAVGIHVSAGTVYVRSLNVGGGMGVGSPGVVADGGELHMDRCIVDGNMHGGILIDGAAYEITNTFITRNGSSMVGCQAWGGVCIVHIAPGTLDRFVNNTVAKNGQVGIFCGDPGLSNPSYPVVGSIAIDSVGGIDTSGCAFSTCCGPGALNLDPQSYRPLAGSSCIDQLDPTMSTAYDFDGHARPFGSMSDCGASEFIPSAP